MRRTTLSSWLLLIGIAPSAAADRTESVWVSGAGFQEQIQPLLATQCVKCHGARKQEANLRLDSLQGILTGGDSGPAIARGNPGQSLLVEAVRHQGPEMPPDERLDDQHIQSFEQWIRAGAVWPDDSGLISPIEANDTGADHEWWAVQPFGRPPVPAVSDNRWCRNPIDRFVLARLDQNQMRPAPRASRETRVRRLYFDLIGLPPSPRQIDAFLNDDAPDAWSRLIDRLLADVRYGEHWGRYWLDVVRYAESDGWKQDAYRPHIWRYRDYVVRSFNSDKSYPQFVLEQLAGDEIQQDDPDCIAATGFLRLGIYEFNQRNAQRHWNDVVNELTDVTADVFLATGMACARCHDHKFDPIPQTDYYRLRAFYEPIVWRDDLVYATDRQQAEYRRQLEPWEEATREIRERIDEIVTPYRVRAANAVIKTFPLDIQACYDKPPVERTSWDHQMAYLVERQGREQSTPLANLSKDDKAEYESLVAELRQFDSLKPPPLGLLMTATDASGPASPTFVPRDTSTAIEPGILSVLDRSGIRCDITDGRRTALAKWIGRADNPLTTRVVVNRIWQHHFGEGLVGSANDFGQRSDPPSHPALLDWLTLDFVDNGWSFKRLHKMILMSATWQQSAMHPSAEIFEQRDPAERLIWRARVRRLLAEQIRDAMLSVTGELSEQLGGESIDGHVTRRSLYVKSFRNSPDELLHAFDAANGLKSVAERSRTTTPIQSLLMANGQFALQRADRWAEQRRNPPQTCGDAIDDAIRAAWGRRPRPAERQQSLAFIEAAADQSCADVETKRWADFYHVLLNSNEFLYVD